MLNSNIWFDGPYFLRGPEELWKNDMPQDDVELKDLQVLQYIQKMRREIAVDKFLKYYSSWHRLRKAVAVYHRLFFILKSKRQTRLNGSITADELDAAGKAVIRYIQRKLLVRKWHSYKRAKGQGGRGLCSSSSIYKLDPFIDPQDMASSR
ncbi:uncharacterized protein LOC135214650 [Macrobrachium nipponense]|uniref:uncharacterized protein LOC135214650 n=1 Tax=Macrobrachium nipponense TaxID=159736 RepID=UPI0030C812F1